MISRKSALNEAVQLIGNVHVYMLCTISKHSDHDRDLGISIDGSMKPLTYTLISQGTISSSFHWKLIIQEDFFTKLKKKTIHMIQSLLNCTNTWWHLSIHPWKQQWSSLSKLQYSSQSIRPNLAWPRKIIQPSVCKECSTRNCVMFFPHLAKRGMKETPWCSTEKLNQNSKISHWYPCVLPAVSKRDECLWVRKVQTILLMQIISTMCIKQRHNFTMNEKKVNDFRRISWSDASCMIYFFE